MINLKLIKKYTYLNTLIPLFNNYSALIILFFLILAHYFSKKDILLPMATSLSFIFPFHEYFVLFLLGGIFFALGIYVFKTSNHKVLGVALVILFLNGLYLGIVWHSFSEQRDLYQDFYSSAAKNNIFLKECADHKISCFKLNSDQEIHSFLSKQTMPDPALNKAIGAYLDGYIDKVVHSDKPIITYSYGNSFYNFYYDYKAIGVYNHANHIGILDYQTLAKVEQQSIKVFYNIIGVATFCWIFLLTILLATHHYIRYYFSKKVVSHE